MNTMSLRVKLILITSGIILTLFGVSEWLSYRQTSALLEQHENILIATADHSLALAKLQETREKMFSHVTTMRILHAAITLLAAVVALNYAWYRVIYGPIRHLLSQINIMGRGTWNAAINIKGTGEIAELATAFNHLGEQLTETMRYVNTSSQLSAFALVGNRLVRQIGIARGQIVTAINLLQKSERSNKAKTDGVLEALEGANSSLGSVERHFETAFERQFEKVSAEFRDGGPEKTLGTALAPPKVISSSRVFG
ncbi:MAG TPA: HAMP domain-containing protein [Bryobacteraceae bacterium]|nr:HAMP domain-containing protein [Bryobacteraceae bacterium]